MSRRRSPERYWVHSDPEGPTAEGAPAPATQPVNACPGECNSSWRWAEKRRMAEERTALERHRQADPDVVKHGHEPTPGAPVWCRPCQDTIRSAIDSLPDRAALVHSREDGKTDGHDSTLLETHRGKLAFAPSLSPAWDTVDEVISWATSLCKLLATHLDEPCPVKDTNAGVPEQNLSRCCAYLTGHLTPLLSAPFAAKAGQRALSLAHRLLMASGRDELTHQLRDDNGALVSCNLCGRRALVRDDGADRIRCRYCKKTWSEDEYDLFVEVVIRAGADA